MKDIRFNKGVKTVDTDVSIYHSKDLQKENQCGVRETTNKNKRNNSELKRKRKSK